MKKVRESPDIVDPRSFSLIDYRHGHGYAVIRGFPAFEDDDPGTWETPRVLDVVFKGIVRVACWRDSGPIHLREATGEEWAAIAARTGRLRRGQRVFLLNADSLEDYVVAFGIEWGEFEIPGGAQSPLVAEDEEYRRRYSPVDGVVYEG